MKDDDDYDDFNNRSGDDDRDDNIDDERFEVLLNIKVFRHVALCCWMTGSRRLEGTNHPNTRCHIQEVLNP
jgi:hypothetical protein